MQTTQSQGSAVSGSSVHTNSATGAGSPSVDASYASTGQLNASALAHDVADLAGQNFQQGEAAFAAIAQQIETTEGPVAAAVFEREVVEQYSQMSAGGLWSPNYKEMGAQVLRQNPLLEIQWESTTSAVTGKGGFSAPLRTLLENNGIQVIPNTNPVPAGSLTKQSGLATGSINNHNGTVAQTAIEARFQQAGLTTATEVNYDTGTAQATNATRSADAVGSVRRVDVEVSVPGVRPELDAKILVESKVGYTSNSGRAAIEAVADGELLRVNRFVRGAGELAENAGKIARPIGIALDIYSLGSAYRADGNEIGVNTQRTVSGIAGSAAGGAAGAWAGAAAGAAIGSIVPGVGTAIGGLVGGIIGGIGGGFGGDVLGKSAFDWFSGV